MGSPLGPEIGARATGMVVGAGTVVDVANMSVGAEGTDTVPEGGCLVHIAKSAGNGSCSSTKVEKNEADFTGTH